ncbi:MAG TPA: TetR/AcrR family transcriptional regulator [Thermomicrobiales bacterium]|jgi:AcrR family transcriptional regulator|nr:TetR/AcrR family transcriptional regulator [Thermomicrobiales bacterium]
MPSDLSSAAPIRSPHERRRRNRAEVRAAILAAAQAVMREQGVAALNLNEVARRLQMRAPSLYEYFPGKNALYDALYLHGITLFAEADARVWATFPPGWERLRAWFEARLALALEQPDLYHLVFDAPVPGFTPGAAGMDVAVAIGVEAERAIAEMIDAGIIAPDLPPDRVRDFLLALRHGIIAETLGKETATPPVAHRFASLVPVVMAVLQAAWEPRHPGGADGAADGKEASP